MGSRQNRRRCARVKIRLETLYASERQEGTGVLADLSHRGALLEDSSIQPRLGAPIRLYVLVRPVAPFELVGNVVRHTDGGFAVEFEKLGPDAQSLVDDAAALVSEPRHPRPQEQRLTR